MLGKYLIIESEVFPNPLPDQSSHSSDPVETVSESEAGTDLVVMARAEKNQWNFTFNLSYGSKEKLRNYCRKEKVTMVYMGTSYTVRIRGFTEKLVQGSEWLSAAPKGLYEISVKITEY